ncbi:hypothetical protein MKW98_012686 [Papaver atlanticum]|uniref:Uncharacterized protein n=1 Tax=Papaver atlanticum TaxID=357466 RepID=A0AAD4SZX8_9MAGN|nr:hypothetical protein MKW98_012686 [Papaver atlanticum]
MQLLKEGFNHITDWYWFHDSHEVGVVIAGNPEDSCVEMQLLPEVDLTDCEAMANPICEAFCDEGGCPVLESLALNNCEGQADVAVACSCGIPRQIVTPDLFTRLLPLFTSLLNDNISRYSSSFCWFALISKKT